MNELPPAVARALIVLGLVAAVALPGLTASYGHRLANGFGVDLVPDRVTEQPLENHTRVAFYLDAFKPDDAQDLSFRSAGSSAVLRAGPLVVPSESATGRVTCAAEGCFRGLVFTFLLPAGGRLEGEWTLEVTATWASETLGRAQSTDRESFHGEGYRFGA